MPTDCRTNLIKPLVLALSSVIALSAPAWSQVSGNNYINNIFGNVVVGRSLVNPDPAIEGRRLSINHQIELGANGRVTLNCSNGGIHTLDGPNIYQVSDYCSGGGRRRRLRERSRLSRGAPRSSYLPYYPYIISPRNTALLGGDALTIKWYPEEGAEFYEVTISGSSPNEWEVLSAQVTEPQVTFSNADLSLLTPNSHYNITVLANNTSSHALPREEVGFMLLSESERDLVNARVEEIKSRQLEPDIEAIALALEYLGFEHSDPDWSDPDWQNYALNEAALEVLETRIQAGTENIEIYLLQAKTYLSVECPPTRDYWYESRCAAALETVETRDLQAERYWGPALIQDRYEQALAFAQAAEQRELQAESYWGLATLTESQKKYRDAISYAQRAMQLYWELGDRRHLETLDAKIESWQKMLRVLPEEPLM